MQSISIPRYLYHLQPATSSLSKTLLRCKAGPKLLKATPHRPIRLCTWAAFPGNVRSLLGQYPHEILLLQLHTKRLVQEKEFKGLLPNGETEAMVLDEKERQEVRVAKLGKGYIDLRDVHAVKVLERDLKVSADQGWVPKKDIGGEEDDGWKLLQMVNGGEKYCFVQRSQGGGGGGCLGDFGELGLMGALFDFSF